MSLGITRLQAEELVQAHIGKLRADVKQENLERDKRIADLTNKCGSLMLEVKTLKAQKHNTDATASVDKDRLQMNRNSQVSTTRGRSKKSRK